MKLLTTLFIILILCGCLASRARPKEIILDEKPKIAIIAELIHGKKYKITINSESTVPMFTYSDIKESIRVDNTSIYIENSSNFSEFKQINFKDEYCKNINIEILPLEHAPKDVISLRFSFQPMLGVMNTPLSGSYYYKYVYFSNEVKFDNR